MISRRLKMEVVKVHRPLAIRAAFTVMGDEAGHNAIFDSASSHRLKSIYGGHDERKPQRIAFDKCVKGGRNANDPPG
jgi:hypothetical protein